MTSNNLAERPTTNIKESIPLFDLFLIVFLIATTILIWILRISIPLPINYGEGPLLDQAVRLANFENIYQPITDSPPWTISNYPPLYVLLNVPFVFLFGPAFWYGRALSAVASIGSAILIAKICQKLGGSRRSCAISAAVFLASYPVVVWNSLMRVDALALALEIAAIYCSLIATRKNNLNILLPLVLTFVALTRWINVFFPLVVVTFIVYRRFNLAQAARVVVCSISGIAASFGLLTLLSRGWFWSHVFTSNVNAWTAERLLIAIAKIIDLAPALTIIVAILFASLILKQLRVNYLSYFFIAVSAISALAIGKVGSDVNYVLELTASLAIFYALFLNSLPRSSLRVFLSFSLGVFLLVPNLQIAIETSEYSFNSEVSETKNKLSGLIEKHHGRVLSDVLLGAEVLNGYRMQYQPFEMQMCSQQKLWDANNLDRAIADRTFTLVILQTDRNSTLFQQRWGEEFSKKLDFFPYKQQMHLPWLSFDVFELDPTER